MLCIFNTLVPMFVLPFVAHQSVGIVHPPESGHDFQTVFLYVVVNKRESERNLQRSRVVSFGDEDVGCETAWKCNGRAESGPETASGEQIYVVLASVVVGAEGRTCGHVALPLNVCGNQERVAVVLFVAGVEEGVTDFAARNVAVVADDGLIDACPFADADLLSDKGIRQESAGVDVRTFMYDGAADNDPGTQTGGLILGGGNENLFKFATTRQFGVCVNVGVMDGSDVFNGDVFTDIAHGLGTVVGVKVWLSDVQGRTYVRCVHAGHGHDGVASVFVAEIQRVREPFSCKRQLSDVGEFRVSTNVVVCYLQNVRHRDVVLNFHFAVEVAVADV